MADTIALVPVFSGVISNTTVQLCDARILHAFMQVRRDFTTWIKGRIRKFGFALGEDYLIAKSGEQVQKEVFTKSGENLGLELDSPNRGNQVRAHGGDRKSTDYHLTLDMAKELAMVENNEQGRAARRYFIECERKVLAVAAPQPAQQVLPLDRDLHHAVAQLSRQVAQLAHQGSAGNLLPEAQAKEITDRLDRLGRMFHPFSDQFLDVLGITRALRGLHPRLSTSEPGYRPVLPQSA